MSNKVLLDKLYQNSFNNLKNIEEVNLNVKQKDMSIDNPWYILVIIKMEEIYLIKIIFFTS
jgi:hypothetical protein